jgi:hypothetical protein
LQVGVLLATAQVFPQPPQFDVSEFVSVQYAGPVPESMNPPSGPRRQIVGVPEGHTRPQVPFAQTGAVLGQMFPQVPQFCESVCRLISQPSVASPLQSK